MTRPTSTRSWLPAIAVVVVIVLAAWLAASVLLPSVAVAPASHAPSGHPPAGGAPASAAPSVTSDLAPTGPTQDAIVIRVVDGDTAVIEVDGRRDRVRYIGIDSPELDDEDPALREAAAAATLANARLVEGRRVVLEQDVSDTDRFGRLLRYVWVDVGAGRWLLVNLELVASGNARARQYPPDIARQDLLFNAQGAARDAGLGLWAPAP